MAYITNFSHFTPEECGIQFPGQPVAYPFTATLQKSSINTVDSFCMNPYGAVSNLDCPEWDPACNCWVTQFMPDEKEPSGISLMELQKMSSECFFIHNNLGNSKEWMGVDYSSPQCSYNCYDIDLKSNPVLKPTPVDYYLINGSGISDGSTFPYAVGISGISGLSLITDYPTTEVPDKLKTADWKICGACFPYYMEYSRTNATFWNTSPKTPLLRRGQMGAYNSQKIKILVNGDRRVRVGMLVNIGIPIGDETNDVITQKRFSGRWMIYRIERVITSSKHSMFLHLMRDGYSIEPTTALSTSSNSTSSKGTKE
jgi:hypothetical protein